MPKKREPYIGPERRQSGSFAFKIGIKSVKEDATKLTVYPHFESNQMPDSGFGIHLVSPHGKSRREGDLRALKQWLRTHGYRVTKNKVLKRHGVPLTKKEILRLAGIELPYPVYRVGLKKTGKK